MHVLYLTMNPNRASTTVPTEGWFRCLRPQGLRPVLVSHKAGAFHAWATAQGIPSYELPLPTPNKRHPWRFLQSVWQLRRLVQRYDIQVIHCNEHDIYPIGQYVARLCRIPVIVSVHFRMDRAYCAWAFSGKRCPDRIIFVSRSNQEACRASLEGIIPQERWMVLYNGLDLDCFVPDQALREDFRAQHGLGTEFLIGTACALRPRKQLEHLFAVGQRLQHPTLRVVLAGGPVPGDEAYAQQLLAEGQRTLGERLLYLGHINELRGLYNALDVFVNTSEEEACSISVIEALACGCPVVGYPSKSVDEQVLPDGGEIVAQDNIMALERAIDTWSSNVNQLERSRLEARHRSEDVFDIRKISQQLWSECYNKLLHPLR